MKRFAIVLTVLLMAGAAFGGPIYDLEVGGLYAVGDYVTVTGATVTAVTYNGVAISEAPFGVGNSVWVYVGSGHTIAVGDLVDVFAPYEEYYDLTELNVGYNLTADPAAYINVVGQAASIPAPIVTTAAAIMADPEHYESCIVTLTDGFHVSEILTYGEWAAYANDGTVIRFDDFWYDDTVLALDMCANFATGMWTYSYGVFELHPFEDGFPVVDCTVSVDEVSLDSIKALYR